MSCELAITSLTFSDTFRASLVLLLRTHISTAGLPSINFKILLFLMLDFMLAMSPNKILAPELEFFNSNFLNVSTNLFSPIVLTLNEPSAKVPPETSCVSDFIRFEISFKESLSLANSI